MEAGLQPTSQILWFYTNDNQTVYKVQQNNYIHSVTSSSEIKNTLITALTSRKVKNSLISVEDYIKTCELQDGYNYMSLVKGDTTLYHFRTGISNIIFV
jgi:hypothetical protein